MSASAKRSVVFAALLLTANAAALRPRALASTPPTDQRSCQLQISQSGTASINVEPDQLVMRVSVKSPVASEAGEAAHKMKEIVDAVDGAKYTQTFRQDSFWDSHLRKTMKGDWAATGTVTLPIEAGKWGASDGSGSKAVSAFINKLLSLAYPEPALSYAPPVQQQHGDRGVKVSIESMHFAVSDEVTKSTQHQALSLAVADAIARIGEAAAPFRPVGSGYGEKQGQDGEKGGASEGIGAQSLSEVRVTNGSGGSYPPLARNGMVGGAAPMAFDQESSVDGDIVEVADLMYAVPQAQPVWQTVSVSACVNL